MPAAVMPVFVLLPLDWDFDIDNNELTWQLKYSIFAFGYAQITNCINVINEIRNSNSPARDQREPNL